VVIAIDGPAGSGKSTVAKECAASLDLVYVNSGELYRAITFKALQALSDPADMERVELLARETTLEITSEGIRVDGELLTDALHTPSVDNWVSQHSGIAKVREIVNAELRRAEGTRDLIVEGRDIATVVFPDAAVKIYLDADVETRAQRRFAQQGGEVPLETLRSTISARDERDRQKRDGALRLAEDAIYLDTSGLTITQVCAKVLDTIQRQYQNQESQNNHGR
jgi:cytidylate kinase